MLKKLSLENYRCFEKTDITFKELTIIVGKNNAGKSTLIESLRILSIVVNRCKFIPYTYPPRWLHLSEITLGISPSINNLDISSKNIFYMYGEPPAKISAEFYCGSKIVIYVGEDAQIFATIFNPQGLNVESKKFAASLNLDQINILPQITALKRNESMIKFETVQRNIDTNLSSRNFRNQLNYFPDDFNKFKDLAEKTWKGLTIHSNSDTIRTQGDLFLFVRDNKFEAEVGWMGHGLQMWLQTMWFLSRASPTETIILDEPDVYMHADLQRRLIKLIKNKYKQIMIATHSVEIMSEVEPENILPINNLIQKQQYANKLPIVQKIVNDIGSVHNIEIARIFSYKKLLIVEGEKEDIKLLTIFQSLLFPDTFEPFDVLPKTFVSGWGGWQRVIGSTKVFRDNKATIITYCIFDSDYHTEEEKIERKEEGKRQQLNLHIWERKEIENYLLVHGAICRAIKKVKPSINIVDSQISEVVNRLCEELKDDVIDCFATEINNRDKSISIKTANQKARAYVNEKWENDKYKIVSGKQILALLCSWVNENYKVTINRFSIARALKREELNIELVNVITKIENLQDL